MEQQVSPDGYKQTEVGVIPEDWFVASIADVASMKSGSSITSESIDNYSAYPCFGGNGLRGYTKTYTHKGNFALIGRQGALCGNVVQASGKFFASEHAIIVTPQSHINVSWLTIVLKNMNLNQYSESSAQPGLSAQKLQVLKFGLPEKQEQTAIANVLSDVDALIASIEKLIAKKQAIKTATMQQLLTGKKRLPPFDKHPDGTPKGTKQTELGEIPEDWEVKRFKDICNVNQGLQISIEQRKKIPTTKSKIYITIQYINSDDEAEYIDDYTAPVCCEKKDVLMTRTGNTGVVITGVEGVFHNNFFKVNFDRKLYESGYLTFYLRSPVCQKTILEKAGTSTIPDLNHGDFYSINLPVPSFKEQSAISELLSCMEDDIHAVQLRLTKTQQIKQGMMQELLTGKTRLV